jgi:hypothetical protein
MDTDLPGAASTSDPKAVSGERGKSLSVETLTKTERGNDKIPEGS